MAAKRTIVVIQHGDDPLGQAILQGTRLRILTFLASRAAEERGLSLQEIGELLSCSPQNAHHHLRILAKHDLVRVLREERTQRIPRQFWTSDVREIRFRDPAEDDDGRLRLVLRSDE